MKQFVINVPEDKTDFFTQLIEQLGLELESSVETEILSSEQKKGIFHAIQQADNGEIIGIEEFEKSIL
ncbi:MAG: hypothetical protein ACI85I_001670 [Arenicella sp.]|jgi:hypothetical protein